MKNREKRELRKTNRASVICGMLSNTLMYNICNWSPHRRGTKKNFEETMDKTPNLMKIINPLIKEDEENAKHKK